MTPGASFLAPTDARGGQAPQAERPWFDKLVGLLFAILCFEIGIFLLAFPWSRYWGYNYFGWLSRDWHEIWMNSYFRGAVSGVGLVNLYLSLLEVFRLQRLFFRPK